MAPNQPVITWEDVSTIVWQLERSYNVRVLITMERPDGVAQNKALTVTVTARSRLPSDTGKAVAKASTYYPRRQHRSMTGALTYVLTEIGCKLADRQEEAAALGQSRLPL